MMWAFAEILFHLTAIILFGAAVYVWALALGGM
jgi:hypothetical protein